MRKPDFLIVGAAKSGTTSLARYLDQHDRLKLVSERLEFFGEYENPAFKIKNEEEYLSLFEGVPKDVLAGEKSVSYLYSNLASSQIYELNPQAKIIVILRNPIMRAYSDYWHRVRSGVESLTFSEALEQEEKRISEGARFELHYATYGLYGAKIKKYIDTFGRDNVLVLKYDDLKNDPARVCSDCYKFLGVEGGEDIDYEIHNKGGVESSWVKVFLLKLAQNKLVRKVVNLAIPQSIKGKIVASLINSYQKNQYPKMSSEYHRYLVDYYRDDVAFLSTISGIDFSYWLTEDLS